MTIARKTQSYTSPRWPTVSVEFIVHEGALPQIIPGIGPEPATVEIVDITVKGQSVPMAFLEEFGFEVEELQELILGHVPFPASCPFSC